MAWMRGAAVSEEDKLTREQARHVIRRAFSMLRPYKWEVVAAFAVMLGSTAAILAGPALVRYGIDEGLRNRRPGAINGAAIGVPGGGHPRPRALAEPRSCS